MRKVVRNHGHFLCFCCDSVLLTLFMPSCITRFEETIKNPFCLRHEFMCKHCKHDHSIQLKQSYSLVRVWLVVLFTFRQRKRGKTTSSPSMHLFLRRAFPVSHHAISKNMVVKCTALMSLQVIHRFSLF